MRKHHGATAFTAGLIIAAFVSIPIVNLATPLLIGSAVTAVARGCWPSARRFGPPAEAKAMRKHHGATVFTAGLIIAAFVSIPIVNLATPLFGMALMVHMHKRLSGRRPELIEPARKTGVPVV